MIIAFTGHRPDKLWGYNNPAAYLRLENFLFSICEYLAIQHGAVAFISGMAIGVDMCAAKACLRLRDKYPHIKVIAAVPFTGQEKKWPSNTQSEYIGILKKVDKVVIVDQQVPYQVPGQKVGAYHPGKLDMRNRFMVDYCDLLIGIYKGGGGGTKNCLDYAAKVKRKVVVYDPRKI